MPGLRPNGAHRFHNYNHPPKEVKAEEAAVLHYTYARFNDVCALPTLWRLVFLQCSM